MKKIENNFIVTGYVGKDAEIRQFTTASVARFSIAVSRQEKAGDDSSYVSAFMNIEAWRKNENTSSFEHLTKGTPVSYTQLDVYKRQVTYSHKRLRSVSLR